MARLSIIEREDRRIKAVRKFATKRKELKDLLRDLQKDPGANYDAIQTAYEKLRAMPRNASPCRVRRRCRLTGRSRGVYRKVGLCRNMFRIHAMKGEIPGLIKASW